MDLDTSNFIDLSREELESRCKVFVETTKTLQVELENKNQIIYDYKRQIQVYERLEKDFQQEIEIIQNVAKDDFQKYELKLHKLEENVNDLSAKNQQLETCVFEKEEENIHLECELKELNEKLSVANKGSEVDENSQKEIQQLKEENELLKNENQELLFQINALKNEVGCLEEKLMNLRSELENTKESLSCKREELQESKTVSNNLQEELFHLRNELDSFKSKPLDKDTQGNSLFAEVNDKRLEVQHKMVKMKQKYLEMKRDYGGKLQKISELRSENIRLSQELEENIKLRNKDYEYVISTLESRINTLEDLLEKQKKSVVQNINMPENVFDDVFKFMEDTVKSKDTEIEMLKEKINSESQSKILTAKHLSDSNRELRQWKATAAQLKCRVGELEMEISEIKHLKSPELEDDVFDDSEEREGSKSCYLKDIRSIKMCDSDRIRKGVDEESEVEVCTLPHQSLLNNINCCSRNSKRERVTNEGHDFIMKDGVLNTLNDNNGNKENFTEKDDLFSSKEKKVVKFVTNVAEETNKQQPMRRGGKILNSKTWYIPSKPKK